MSRTLPDHRIYDPRNYGAKGDGVADDTAAINAAITAMTAAGGGVLLFSAGTYVTSGGHTIPVPCMVLGHGQGYYHDDGAGGYDYLGVASSLVRCSSGTAFAFTFTAPFAEARDLIVHCVSGTAPTAGGGFRCQGSGAGVTQFSRYQFRNVTILDGYYGIEHAVGSLSVFLNVTCVGQRKYMMYLRDDANADCGDWCIDHCYFVDHVDHATEAAIRYESGGGLKVTGTKFVGPNIGHGIWMHFGTGAASGQLLVSGCSVDGISGNAVRLETAGAGSFHDVLIGGNSYLTTAGAESEAIYINNGGAAGSLGGIVIAGCTLKNFAAEIPAINVTGNGQVDVLLGFVKWAGAATALYTKGASDTVVGGFYADPADGNLAVGSAVSSKGSNAGFLVNGRNGDPGFMVYSDSQAGGLHVYSQNRFENVFTMADDGSFGPTRITTSAGVLNNFADAQLYLKNTLASGSGHESMALDKGDDTAVAAVCYLSKGVPLWDVGAIGDNEYSIRDAVGGFVKRFRVSSAGVGFNGHAPAAPPTLAANATDLASAITLVNQLRSMAINNGLAT